MDEIDKQGVVGYLHTVPKPYICSKCNTCLNCNFSITVPSNEEQNYPDKKCSVIDELIAKTKQYRPKDIKLRDDLILIKNA